ncbi:MAG TPA: cyclic nucleotide-binding domain-containing protein [Candidatus Binatia bacterium]|nr:cyclic nucleotide-binding domain-containing protein [Candidatus Binatia bacterium]
MTTTPYERFSREPAFRALFEAGHQRRWRKHQVVLGEGELPRSLYLLLSGSIAVRLSNWHGREVLLAYMHPGDFFGEMGLFPGVRGRSAEVRTRTECQVLELPYAHFLELAARHPQLWLELGGQIAARLRIANRRLAEMPLLPARERLWSVLVELAERAVQDAAAPVRLKVTRTDLGRLAGCSREAAGLALHEFAAEGRVKLRGQQILMPVPAEVRRSR